MHVSLLILALDFFCVHGVGLVSVTAALPDSVPYWNIGGLKHARVCKLNFAFGTASVESIHMSPLNLMPSTESLKNCTR